MCPMSRVVDFPSNLRRALSFSATPENVHYLLELANVLKLPIDRRKPHIGYRINTPKRIRHHLADMARLHFSGAGDHRPLFLYRLPRLPEWLSALIAFHTPLSCL